MAAKTTLRQKIFLISFGLILAFISIEGGLRAAGKLMTGLAETEYVPSESSYVRELKYQRDSTYESYETTKATKRIVAIGDSFANGGNARSFQTYPYQLFKIFEEQGKAVSVLNMGKCEDSTFGVASRLEKYLGGIKDPAERPDVITVVAGSADKYNMDPEHEDYEVLKVDWHASNAPWYTDLRLYKLYRHIKLGVTSRQLLSDLRGTQPITDEVIAEFKSLYESFKANAKAHHWPKTEDEKELGPAFAARNRELAAAFSQIAPRYFSSANTEYMTTATPTELLSALSTSLVTLYASKVRHDDALALILDVEENYPLHFWMDVGLYYLRFNLYQTYQLQSGHSAEQVLARIDASAKEHPELATWKRWVEFRQLIVDADKMDVFIDQKRAAAWDRIVELCKEHDIQLVVQN